MNAVRIKICGVTTLDDALRVADLGVEAIGFNFYAKSRRYLPPDEAAAIAEALPQSVACVGVFVNATVEHIREVAQQVGLRAVQTYDLPLEADFSPFASIPAYRIKTSKHLKTTRGDLAAARQSGHSPPAVLLDSYVRGEMGGTGHTAPWDLIANFDPGLPVILAGGLKPDNVAAAIDSVRPWGVDVASGVESSPGCKDLDKVKSFVRAVRAAAVGREVWEDVFGCELPKQS